MPGIEDSHLIARATSPEAKRVDGLADFLASLNTNDLIADYEEVKTLAPRRGRDGKSFFLDRSPRPIDRADPKPTEDLLEMALVNSQARLTTPEAEVAVLMRQFPLFSTGSRRGLRAIDLVGHGGDRFWVIELKAQPSAHYGESPARALLEALIYAAVVEANNKDISEELLQRFDLNHDFPRPGIIIAAPSLYWSRWRPNKVTGDWWTTFERLTGELRDNLETPIVGLDLGDAAPAIDDTGQPRLANNPFSRLVRY